MNINEIFKHIEKQKYASDINDVGSSCVGNLILMKLNAEALHNISTVKIEVDSGQGQVIVSLFNKFNKVDSQTFENINNETEQDIAGLIIEYLIYFV